MNPSISSLGTILSPQQVSIPCQVCGRQSNFQCFTCQKTNYCSKQHQKEHWRLTHKNHCVDKNSIKQSKKVDLQKQILQARKNYYQNYSNKIFNHCLLDAKLMTGLSFELLKLEPQNIKFQLQYGASVCLLVRTYRILNDCPSAKHQMENYLKSRKTFLYEIDKYKDMIDSKHNLNEEEREEFQMKLNLVSGIANLCYVIGMNTMEYYVLYTKCIISCFGQNSFEASNCYFLLGCFYAEEGWFNKAVACFEKAAKIRGQFAGDCMYNIGVLYKLMGNLPKALQTLEISMKLREQQYGEDSNQVAQVNELMGSIYADLNDYKTALLQYEKAFRVRCTNPISPQYQNILDMIHELYDKLNLYIKLGQPNMKRPEIYNHLKQQIVGESAYWQHEKYRTKMQRDYEDNEKEEKETVEKYKKKKVLQTEQVTKFSWKDSGLFNVSDNFVSTLNLSELFRLSELQLELEHCDSVFNLAYIVGTSIFFQSLRPQKKKELQKQNQKLFELMQMEDIRKIKHKDK